jgi:microsomal prostaglandin-E synthase 2
VEEQTNRVTDCCFCTVLLLLLLCPLGDLREALYSDANSFIAAVGPRPFMGGDKPNLADLAMFGVLSAIKGTDTYNDLVLNSNIGQWLSRMALTVGDSAEIKHA